MTEITFWGNPFFNMRIFMNNDGAAYTKEKKTKNNAQFHIYGQYKNKHAPSTFNRMCIYAITFRSIISNKKYKEKAHEKEENTSWK